MSKPLLLPIDICDQCGDLLPLVAITPTIKTLMFKRRRWHGQYIRLHDDCAPTWDAAHEETP